MRVDPGEFEIRMRMDVDVEADEASNHQNGEN